MHLLVVGIFTGILSQKFSVQSTTACRAPSRALCTCVVPFALKARSVHMSEGLDLDFPVAPEVGLFKLWPFSAALVSSPVYRAFCSTMLLLWGQQLFLLTWTRPLIEWATEGRLHGRPAPLALFRAPLGRFILWVTLEIEACRVNW